MQNSPDFRKGLLPDNPKVDPNKTTGTVVNIKKPPRTRGEKKELKKDGDSGGYDEFYRRMVDAVDDPTAHVPIDLDDI